MKYSKLDRLGIFGGTFNPIHLGHIETVTKAAALLNLNKVALLPANIPPHKDCPDISNTHRVEMLERVCQQDPHFYVEHFELNQADTSFTVKTLQALTKKHNHHQLFFFIGMDSLINFHSWYKYKEILTLCNLIVSTRPGYDIDDANHEIKKSVITYQEYQQCSDDIEHGRIILMPEVYIDNASSTIRHMIEKNIPVHHLLPKSVVEYINTNNLYRAPDNN